MAGGRPLGTLSDPARCARAWHWLAATMALACVDKARDLDRPVSPSCQWLDRTPPLDQVRQDGHAHYQFNASGLTPLFHSPGSTPPFKSTLIHSSHTPLSTL